MARRTYRVSRYGLTACPGCAAHIKIDGDDWRRTVCPFCDAALVAREAPPGRIPGRAGLLTAGLFSLSLAACDDTDSSGEDAGGGADVMVDGALADMAPEPDMAPEDDMAVEPDMGPEPDMQLAPDFGGQPEYGKPADDFGVEPELDMQPAPDFGGQPEYGGPPPDFDMGPPTEPDQAVPAPLYGIPPMFDAAPPSSDAEVDAEEPVPVPLYGVPPQEEEA